ncbi:hypothetical protein K458DRAFT_426553 [Lentithecium fluviatile CBS 122367]|uniref:Uncharacterized protein n=1 Tax=Lentithecium fluviatile CBS 122367 TaxID=1168545 RepID=A0A6G1JL34_9PLEO|nr:hypothetical protein K458DRAFT_426553 [Lentithecium fluviatile CBS 122367]
MVALPIVPIPRDFASFSAYTPAPAGHWPLVFIADSVAGHIVSFDPNTRKHSIYAEHSSMHPPTLKPPIRHPVGIYVDIINLKPDLESVECLTGKRLRQFNCSRDFTIYRYRRTNRVNMIVCSLGFVVKMWRSRVYGAVEVGIEGKVLLVDRERRRADCGLLSSCASSGRRAGGEKHGQVLRLGLREYSTRYHQEMVLSKDLMRMVGPFEETVEEEVEDQVSAIHWAMVVKKYQESITRAH